MSRRPTTRYPLSLDTAAPGRLVRMRQRQPAPDRDPLPYLGRVLLPLPATLKRQSTYTIRAGDRIDRVAARLLGDPLLYWMLLEANGASDPASLCAVPGRRIVVPAGVGHQHGALDQPQASRRSAAPAPVALGDDDAERP